MAIREAKIEDIKKIQWVRNAVKENTLSNPALVTDEDCKLFLTQYGKGWVYEKDEKIIGFSIVDLAKHNVWALFLLPVYEKQGIGKQLHSTMLDWYFSKTKINIWLGTSPNTRAEIFYRKNGWLEIGKHDHDEIKFEMTYENWLKQRTDG